MSPTNETDAPADRRASAWVRVSTLATCVFVGVVFTRWAATTGLWCDELLILRAIRLGAWDGLCVAGSSHPPLVRWIAGACVPDGASDLGWRVPSLVFALATVVVWSRILARLFDDAPTVALLLPALALNAAWATSAYQLSPYPLLVLLASIHVWSWLLVLERPGRARWFAFALSAALAGWTHFFGLGLIAVDALLGAALWSTRRLAGRALRAWFASALAATLLVLPVLPILAFYARAEREFAIVEVRERFDYALWAARSLFKATTTYRVDFAPLAWLALYTALGVLGWVAWRSSRAVDGARAASSGRETEVEAVPPSRTVCLPELASSTAAIASSDRTTRALITLAACLPGMPAAQAFSLVCARAVFERYALAGAWANPIALVLALRFVAGRGSARVLAAALLALGLARFATGTGVYATETHDWTPVVEHLAAHAKPGDAFFVQDFDVWTGSAAFDALWNERYGRGLLASVHGAPLRRAQLASEGLTLDSLPRSVRRAWVFSHLFTTDALEHMPRAHAEHWELRELTSFGRAPPLALFERVD